MHLLGWLPKGIDDAACAATLHANGVESLPLSQFASAPSNPGGLLLGYAPFDQRAIETGVERMAAILESEVVPSR